MEFKFGDVAIFQFPHQGGSAQADLIHAITAIDHQRMLSAQALQGADLDTHQIRVEHAHQDIGCARRVGQRPQDIEERAHTQFFANRRHVFHGGVVIRCEHETDAGLRNRLRDALWRQVDVHTQTLQYISAARLAAHTAAAVLGGFGARSSSHKHGAGGNIEGV